MLVRAFGYGQPGAFPGMRPGFARGGHLLFGPGIGLALLAVVWTAILVVVFWQLYKKAGYEGGLGLMMLVPFVNVAAMLFLAFSEWPVLKELREAREADTPPV